MTNPFDQIRETLNQARSLQRAADNAANDMAAMLIGRLRHVSGSQLKMLKRELRTFNIHTERWRASK